MPDFNNVYGHVVTPHGLDSVLKAVSRLAGVNRAFVKKSQFDRAETLSFSSDTADFDSTPLEGGHRHLLNGAVEGTLQNVVRFVQSMSELLAEAGIEHKFEVYDTEQNLVKVVPETGQARE
jgi:hypothetical protein